MGNKDIILDPETKRFGVKREGAMVERNNQSKIEPGAENLPGDDSLASQIREMLADGIKGKDIIEMGYAESTVRQEARKFAKKNGSPKTNGNDKVSLTIKEKEQVLPEWLESQVGELYDGDEKTRKIFMAGMSIPLLGMRLFSESFKPLLALMQANTASQAEVAKSLQGGSEEVAQQTLVQAMPYFQDMVKEVSRNQAVNPLQSMMVRAIEPVFQNVIGGVMGGMFPGMKQPQGQGQGQSLPAGWQDETKGGK